MTLPCFRVSTLILVAAVLTSAPVFAQSVGSIAGTVVDASKAGVPGAVVTARNEGTGAVREVVTDVAGRYAMPLLPVGGYTVTVTMTGFKTLERSKIALEVQASLTLDFVLELSTISESITVTSQAGMVQLQRSDASLGQLINSPQVAEL